MPSDRRPNHEVPEKHGNIERQPELKSVPDVEPTEERKFAQEFREQFE